MMAETGILPSIMCNERLDTPRVLRCVAGFTGRIAPLLLLSLQFPARAACLSSPDAGIRAMQTLAHREPADAVRRIQAAIHSEMTAPQPNAPKIAALYAVLADANEALELDGAARSAASEGLKYAVRADESVRMNLLAALAANIYDVQGLKDATAMIETARATVPSGSITDVCLQITLGNLQYRQDRDDLATFNLTSAYRISDKAGWSSQRVLAAEGLSHALRNSGDFEQSLSLNQEVIDWSDARNLSLDLSVALYLRGEIFRAMRDYPAAIAAYEKARRISEDIGDQQGIAFSDLRSCQVQTEINQWNPARIRCESALRVFSASQSKDVLKEARTLLARIDLAQNRPARALQTLNEVLDHQGSDMPPRQVAMLFEQRARTLAALGRFEEAFRDLDEYARRNAKEAGAERVKQTAVLRARFETDRQVERNASLQNQLDLAKERVHRQTDQLRWTVTAILAGACVILLMAYILFTGQRHKRQLVDLAGHDGLTGLPNRRRSVEVATAALESAEEQHRPVAIALIDLDHFKLINDRHGHAAGDNVLKEFARVGRESLRATDFLGRWGGEEFIVVLSDMTLDIAMTSIERLRTAALQIKLPVKGDEALHVSFSAGLATNESGIRTLDDIIAQADVALYEAKSNGRDLVKIAEASFDSASTGVRRALRRTSRTGTGAPPVSSAS